MQLQDIYFVSEIVAAGAVIATLLFVGIQIRQNTAALASSAKQANSTNWSHTPLTLATSDGLVESIAIAGQQPPETWSPQDYLRLGGFTVASMKNLELNHSQWLDGNLSDELWLAARDGAVDFIATSPYIEILWQQGLYRNFPSGFRGLFEELVAAGKADIETGQRARWVSGGKILGSDVSN